MRINLKEQDIINIVKGLLTEQELPPLADEFKRFMVTSRTANSFVQYGQYVNVIDIGSYYTLYPYGGQTQLILFDKDLFNIREEYPQDDYELEYNFIRDLYSKGNVEFAGRGDINIRKAFEGKLFDQYVSVIKKELAGSKCNKMWDPTNMETMFIIHSSGSIFAFIKMYHGKPNLYIINDLIDYFDITITDDYFRTVISRAFSLAFGIDNIDIGYDPRKNVLYGGLERWEFIKTVGANEMLKEINK